MTGTSARNYGFFKSNKARILAIKYNLPIDNKLAYGINISRPNQKINYNDVLFIVENLWIDHFLYYSNGGEHRPCPIKLSNNDYKEWCIYIKSKYPNLF